MALEIEDGSAKLNSQSYVSVAELVDYAALRGVELPVEEAAREAMLIEAVDLLEKLAVDPGYIGRRKTREQALAWPRTDAAVEGFELLEDEIPRELKMAQMQLALDSLVVNLLPTALNPSQGAVVEETVEGAVSVKYAAPRAPVASGPQLVPGAQLARASAFVSPLLRAFAPLLQVPVGRA